MQGYREINIKLVNSISIISISINSVLKGKKIMVFLMTFAVVAVMIAQAVNVEDKLD